VTKIYKSMGTLQNERRRLLMHKVPSHLLQNTNSSNSRENIVWAMSIRCTGPKLLSFHNTYGTLLLLLLLFTPFMLVKISVVCVNGLGLTLRVRVCAKINTFIFFT
jgi:hypothetical protein